MSPVSVAECKCTNPASESSAVLWGFWVCFFCFFFTILSSNVFSFSVTSTLRWDNNRSGATHVTTIFTVYVGVSSVIVDGYWIKSSLLVFNVLSWTAFICSLNDTTRVFCVYFCLANLYLMCAESSSWDDYCPVGWLIVYVCTWGGKKKNLEVSWV